MVQQENQGAGHQDACGSTPTWTHGEGGLPSLTSDRETGPDLSEVPCSSALGCCEARDAGKRTRNLLVCPEEEGQRSNHLLAQARSKPVIMATLERETRHENLSQILPGNRMLVKRQLSGHGLGWAEYESFAWGMWLAQGLILRIKLCPRSFSFCLYSNLGFLQGPEAWGHDQKGFSGQASPLWKVIHLNFWQSLQDTHAALWIWDSNTCRRLWHNLF